MADSGALVVAQMVSVGWYAWFDGETDGSIIEKHRLTRETSVSLSGSFSTLPHTRCSVRGLADTALKTA